jgi:hypothetical protein
MSQLVTCPECQAKYRVKEHLQGKRFRCKVCQAAVPVVSAVEADEPKVSLDALLDDDDAQKTDDEMSRETSTDLEIFGDTEESLVLPRSSYQIDRLDVVRRGHLSPFQRLASGVGRSAWVTLGILFFAAWVPFSLLEPAFVWWMNVVGIALCAAGCVTGMVLEMMEMSFPDPWATVNRATIGELAACFVSAEHLGPPPSRISGQTLAKQFGWMIGFLAIHTVALTLLKHFQVLP